MRGWVRKSDLGEYFGKVFLFYNGSCEVTTESNKNKMQ